MRTYRRRSARTVTGRTVGRDEPVRQHALYVGCVVPRGQRDPRHQPRRGLHQLPRLHTELSALPAAYAGADNHDLLVWSITEGSLNHKPHRGEAVDIHAMCSAAHRDLVYVSVVSAMIQPPFSVRAAAHCPDGVVERTVVAQTDERPAV